MGNIFARRAGLNNDLPPVLAGSHLDSQPTGGKFDGVYGVLAALEVVETLNDQQIQTTAPLEIVSWTNEEGARFAPAMIASGVFTGVFDLAYGWLDDDGDGHSIGYALQQIGYMGDTPSRQRLSTHRARPHFGERRQSGGHRDGRAGSWYELIIEGKETHAGPTPMNHRRDPVQA